MPLPEISSPGTIMPLDTDTVDGRAKHDHDELV